MDEREIENELKKEADRTEMESFSSRFEKIQQRERAEQLLEQETVKETIPELINGSEPDNARRAPNKTLIISIAFAVLCLLVLAIVLPLTLNKKPPIGFGKGESSLYSRVTTEKEFYCELQAVGIAVPDLSECEVESYGLILLTEDDTVKGGRVGYYDGRNNSFVTLEIYSADVEVKIGTNDFDNKCETVTIQGTTVQYLIVESDEEGAYRMLATASNNKYNYQFEIISDDENILSVFEALFV